jgi:glutamate synthase (NADPH/NADH) small chain
LTTAETAGASTGILEERFSDHKPLYTAAEAMSEASRCLYCHDAPCIHACPTHIDVPSFIRKIANDSLLGAARTILTSNMLGYSCSRVCPVEVLCVGACVYNLEDVPPIAIGRLQRYATETILTSGRRVFTPVARSGKRVALVGAGPASLACAAHLSLHGVEAVILERRSVAGGLNATGIAPYKMEGDAAQREVEFIRSLGVTIETGVNVDAGRAQGLLEEYDAVFLGVGLGSDKLLNVPGEDGPGVLGATTWIERMKTMPGASLTGVNAAVIIGGGNTALDAARELAQLGVAAVTVVYRRSEGDMPGFAHERAHARTEGVRFLFGRVPVLALTVRQNEGGGEDDLPADLILAAIGQRRLADFAAFFPGVEVDAKGHFVADPATGRTGNPKVYVGGDAFNGGSEVVNAAQDGKLAAQAILRSFGLDVSLETPPRSAYPLLPTVVHHG